MAARATARYNTSSVFGGVSGGGGDGAWRYALQAGHRQSDGFNAIFNPENFSYNPDRDGYRNDNVSGSVAFRFAPEQEISAQVFRSRLNAQFDAGQGFDDRTITTVRKLFDREPQPIGDVLDERRSGRRRTGDDSNSETGFRPVALPYPPAPVFVAERAHARLWPPDASLPSGARSGSTPTRVLP